MSKVWFFLFFASMLYTCFSMLFKLTQLTIFHKGLYVVRRSFFPVIIFVIMLVFRNYIWIHSALQLLHSKMSSRHAASESVEACKRRLASVCVLRRECLASETAEVEELCLAWCWARKKTTGFGLLNQGGMPPANVRPSPAPQERETHHAHLRLSQQCQILSLLTLYNTSLPPVKTTIPPQHNWQVKWAYLVVWCARYFCSI